MGIKKERLLDEYIMSFKKRGAIYHSYKWKSYGRMGHLTTLVEALLKEKDWEEVRFSLKMSHGLTDE